MEAQSESTAPARNSALRSSKLRYPLRSASRVKEAPDSSAQKRLAKPSADVIKSVSILELSGKEKSSSAKPPRRLSTIPTKPNSTPGSTRPNGSNGLLKTPNSTRPNIPKSDTPLSNASGSAIARRKFNIISSVSYWTTQIKLAEAASKHNISLGFFKLAFESGCEPLDRMKEELKSYIINHNLSAEMPNPINELLSLYNVTDDLETLKISCPKKSESPKAVSGKPERNPKTAPVSSSVAKRNGNLKPRSLNTDTNAGSRVRVSNSNNLVKGAVAKEKNPKKMKKEKKEENGEKENENGSENALAEESGSTDDIAQKQEVSAKEQNENTENAPSVELSSEEEKENTLEVPFAEVSTVVLEA